MKDVLINLANWLMLQKCEELAIDPSNSHCIKNGRGFKYSLIYNNTDDIFITVIFTQNSAPMFNTYSHETRNRS